ncbi:Retrovirus-related Pol polyprotein from type-1 retrotransposable element R1 [Araneus ventricosus]|uniref:Retrovirus-related Pol polyprotein from type-1 retrotransposable element R1 n=1 Tax=Araneus ventricosus TaxID=182803 RepID=A0A4Y2JGB1_ARAVE|nr:Retrovirus-related Pol polyprotein from type-1 retrotransposable element R1 [Araneus ventricosus]
MQETHVQRKKRETVNTYSSTILDKQFTKQEITYAISTVKKKKVPGIDGISIEIIRELHDMNRDILHYIYNKCLELGIFPETWNKGKLIIFYKSGKDPSLPNAYRPICSLSVLGKILDKLLVFRITHLLHKNNRLHEQQYGFRNGRFCETANFRLRQAINIALQERVPVTLLCLDVQCAFDTDWRTSILFQLPQDEEVWNLDNQKGVPQGSCSGPLFWNLVMDTALDLLLPQGSHIQAYADDIIVAIRYG